MAGPGLAHAGLFDEIIGGPDVEKEFVEIVPVMPEAPKPENLTSFYVSPATNFRFFVDTHSISIGKDGVVHYTLIARSPEGANNISFEGMRCSNRTYKVYAYLGANDTFRPRTDPQWARIDEAEANRQRASLYKDYICPSGVPLRVNDVVLALKSNPYSAIGP
jgi:hypothetical protein